MAELIHQFREPVRSPDGGLRRPGVGPSLGTDFSFALLFGQQGADAEAANGDKALGPPSFGSDVSIQNATNYFGPNQFLGISA